MLTKSKLIAQEIPDRLAEHAVWCRMWGENGLAVHFYDGNGQPEVSWWSDGKNSVKYCRKTREWTTGGLHGILPGLYNVTRRPADEESEKRAREWAKDNKVTYWSRESIQGICMSFDSHRNYERRTKAEAGKIERMEREFAAFPQRRDEAVQAWIDRRLPQYLMYGKLNRRRERELRCTACGGTWTEANPNLQRGRRGNCPICGGEGKYHPTFGKEPKAEWRAVWTVERDRNTTWWRVTSYGRWITKDGNKRWAAEDTLRIRETRTSVLTGTERRAYVNGQWGWKRCKRDDVWERHALVYPGTLSEALGTSIGNTPTALLGTIAHPISLYHAVDALRTVTGAEYYAKLGMWRLLMDSYRSGVSIPVPPNLRYLARRYDVSGDELEQLKLYGEVPPDRFEAIRELHGGRFKRSYMEMNMGIDTYIHNFRRWKAKNPKAQTIQIEQWYNDYIGMCRSQGVDTARKEVRFPRDLKAEHDRLAERVKMAEAENANAAFAAACEKLYAPMHGYTDNKYTVVFPQKRTDLIAEGQSLHHCVGSALYYQSHMRGVRMIFFIRKAAEPGKPLYTMEADVQKLEIIQLYGAHDKPAPKEVKVFCERFLRQLWTGTEEKVQKCS